MSPTRLVEATVWLAAILGISTVLVATSLAPELAQAGEALRRYMVAGWSVVANDDRAGEPVVSLNRNPGASVRRDLCLRIAVAEAAEYECGDLRLVHALPSVTTMGQLRTPMLTYNSQHASPYPIVRAEVTRPSGVAQPDSTEAVLKIDGVTVASGWWDGSVRRASSRTSSTPS